MRCRIIIQNGSVAGVFSDQEAFDANLDVCIIDVNSHAELKDAICNDLTTQGMIPIEESIIEYPN